MKSKELAPNNEYSAELFDFTPESWRQIKDDILRIEKECFGEKGYTEDRFKKEFESPGIVIFVLRNPSGKIIGYTYSEPFRKPKTTTIDSTAIDPAYQGRGLVGKLIGGLEDELRKRGFEFIQRDAAVTNGYADSIQRFYGERVVRTFDHPSKYGPQRFFRIKL